MIRKTSRRLTMKKKTVWMLWVLVAALALPGWSQQTDNVLKLSLDDCITRALKDNLSVAIQVLNPEISATSVARSEEKYIPTLSVDWSSRNTESASYSFLDAAGTAIVDATNNFGFTANQTLPFGGSLSISLSGYKTDSNRTGSTINPRYSSTLRLNFNQPLLKDFGSKMSRREILIARNNYQVSEYQLKRTLMDTIYSIESAYWSLVYSLDNLEVRRQSLQLARDLLEKNKRSVEIGTLAPMDVLSAQAEVATREADLIQAETQVLSNEDQIKVLLNIPEEESRRITAIVPTDEASFVEVTYGLDEALAIAIENRPDLETMKLQMMNEQFNLSYQKNQLLPDLNLTVSYWSPGVSGTQILYDGNPIFGIVIGEIPGGITDSLKDTFNFKYTNWSLGLSLGIPLNTLLSKASYTQAKLNLRQAKLELENQEQQIYLEIKNAVRTVEANYRRIIAYKLARELAEQKLSAEEEKLKVGLTTNYMVLSYQRDLANARISELNSIIAYNVSLAGLERSLGISLREKNIRFGDFLPD
jgi:outer membrane protein TolC